MENDLKTHSQSLPAADTSGCECHEIPGSFGSTGLACTYQTDAAVVGLHENGRPSLSAAQVRARGMSEEDIERWIAAVDRADERVGFSEDDGEEQPMPGKSFTEAPHEFRVLRPNESPVLRRQQAEAEARAKEERGIEAEARRRLSEKAEHDAYERRVRAKMRQLGGGVA